ncbi:heterokaryon incompatibility protein het-6-like protein [Colletotrichum musicola]|uniref:Heterokaryon incompatibility protein het-6-like protein n=1 Tax=Colletotrichum musicola TaxID=2175873 RepID=A0A8H6MR04_9PEZI|nr:heterokaryon incompatibility protein het-6-like protein [Colletotrichum musicola]
MSRWHRPSCARPVIVVEQERPSCKTCNQTPDLEGLLKAQAGDTSSTLVLPPDEPPGQLGLWWPPCVPYGNKGKRLDAQSASIPGGSTSPPQNAKGHSVYPSRLQKDEFRVLCLSPVRDVDYPVHVDLETYADEQHAEYETVSYTWGGEEGDSASCRPVYVGEHWDVLWQTRNCWEMLRYLRPRRGVRIVWVDAICINQNDLEERQQQVAKMGLIYERTFRVVVYLGPDVTPPTSTSSPHPRRHYLHEHDSLAVKPRLPPPSAGSSASPTLDLKLSGLFEREYFRRLWIIQELIMSRNITLRIGDVEFTVDREVNFRTASPSNHALPWLQFVTQRFIGGAGGNDLLSAVDLTRQSRASDPRDKIFGLLGLVRSSGRDAVAPAYSISFRHLLLGYFAYCLLVQKDIRVIANAAGLGAAVGMPSWALAIPDGGGAAPLTIPSLSGRRPNDLYEMDDFVDAYMEHHHGGGEMPVRPDHPLGRSAARQWSAREVGYTCTKLGFDWEAWPDGDSCAERTRQTSEEAECWHSGAWMDSSTGCVNLSSVHILSFDDLNLSKARVFQHGKVLTYVFPAGPSTLYLHTADAIFDDVNKPSGNQLFALCDASRPDDDSSNFFGSRLCVLRRLEEADGAEGAFRMVSAAVDVCFHVPRQPSRSYDLFSVPDLPVVLMWNIFRWRKKLIFPRDSELSVSLPLVRNDELQAELLPDWRIGWKVAPPLVRDGELFIPDRRSRLKSQDPASNREVLTAEALSRTLFSLLDSLRREWITSWGSGAPDRHQAGRYFTYNTVDYFRYPWPMLAMPGVSDPGKFFRVLQAVLDAERSESAAGFFAVYFDMLRAFEPRALGWNDQRGLEAYGLWVQDEAVLPLVELKFEPHQFEVLEAVLDFIMEDVEDEMSIHKEAGVGKPADGRAYPRRRQGCIPRMEPVYRPFLRIGWKETPTAVSDDGRKMVDKPWIGDEDGIYAFIRQSWTHLDKTIREHRGQTIWVAFDLLSFTMWAQAHPCMTVLRGLSRFCRDGEDEMTRLLRVPEEEDKKIVVPSWPNDIIEDFAMSIERLSVRIT